MSEPATIIIADISGYTEFMMRTELEHSSHIIKELLECVADCNMLDLTLSEIEGDALLFYRKGPPIEVSSLVKQFTCMFESFHKQLRIIERDSICLCGACQEASNLTMKFVAHHGTIKELKISGLTNASGVDMIIAHRLMKNQIDSHEYVLVTRGHLDSLSDSSLPPELSWTNGSEEYPAIGTVEYAYACLDCIKSAIPPAPVRATPVIEAGEGGLEVDIKAPLKEVYRELLDVDGRSRWFLGSEVTKRDNHAERTGFKHDCLFLGKLFEITILGSQIGESKITYAEDLKMIETGTRFLDTFVLSHNEDGGTRLAFNRKEVEGPTLPQEVADHVASLMKKNLEALKQLCEVRDTR